MKTQYTDEFGGYSKTWFSDGLKEMRNQTDESILDDDKTGVDAGFGLDCLARSLGLDITALAVKYALDDDLNPPAVESSYMIDPEMDAETPHGPMKAHEVIRGVFVKGN